MDSTRNSPLRQRGFALLFVMLLVALLGIGSAALLDLVSIDLSIAGEHAKTLSAETAAIGATLEVVGDPDFVEALPANTDPDLRTVLVDRVATNYLRYPDAAGSAVALSEVNSAHIRGFGTVTEDGYVSDVQFLRVVHREDTSTQYGTGIFEVRVRASVAGGDATRESRVIIHRPVAVSPDAAVQHAR